MILSNQTLALDYIYNQILTSGKFSFFMYWCNMYLKYHDFCSPLLEMTALILHPAWGYLVHYCRQTPRISFQYRNFLVAQPHMRIIFRNPRIIELHPQHYLNIWNGIATFKYSSRTTVSQDVQSQFSVELAFAKFLSKIKGNF